MSFQRWIFSSSRQLFFDDDDGEDENKIEVIRTLPNLYFSEKLLLIVDYFQIFGLLWTCAQPWGLPYLFSLYTRPLLYVNLDFFSLSSNGAKIGNLLATDSRWGKMENYIYYAALYSLVQFMVFALICYFRVAQDTYSQSMRSSSFGKELKRYDKAILLLLALSEIIYLPCCLAVFRLFHLETIAGSYVLSADPTTQASDLMYKIIVITASVLTGSVIIGLPVMLNGYISRTIVYTDRLDHEKRLQIWELLYMLKVDRKWIQKQLWVTSSFRLFGAYFRLHMVLLKFILVAIGIGLRSSFVAQSTMFTLAVATFSIYYVFWRMPYRALSSNMILLLVFALLTTNSCFAMGNAYGIENAVMVASTQAFSLFAINAVCFILMVIVFFFYASFLTFGQRADFPCMKTIQRILSDPPLESKVAHWVQVMKESIIVKQDFITTPTEVADINMLEESIRLLRSCWVSAKIRGSIFETPLGEHLEDLMRIHATKLPNALRKYPHWDKSYMAASKVDVFLKREAKYRIFDPLKRRILLKLLAFRFIKGDRDFGAFNLKLGKKHSELMKNLDAAKKRRDAKRRELEQGGVLSSSLGLQDNAKVKMFGYKLFEMNARSLMDNIEAAVPVPMTQSQTRLKEELDADENVITDLEQNIEAEGEAATEERIASEEARLQKENEPLEETIDPNEQDDLEADTGEVMEPTPHGNEEDNEEPDEQYDSNGNRIFSQQEIDGSAAMITTLKKQTEQVLSKYHQASLAIKKSINVEQWASGSEIDKFTSFKVLRETIDPEEQDDLENLYLLWDEAIQLFEDGQFPGDQDDLMNDVENWYTYRGLISERLELVMNILAEKQFDFEQLDAEAIAEVEEEDFDSDGSKEMDGSSDHTDEDDNNDNEEHPLLQQYQKSKKFPTFPSASSKGVDGEGGMDIEENGGMEEYTASPMHSELDDYAGGR